MLSRLKQYFWIGLLIALFYYLLSNHFVFLSAKSFEILKKDQLTLRYTFYSLANKSPEKVLKIDPLRQAGIGAVMVDHGLISAEKLKQWVRTIESDRSSF